MGTAPEPGDQEGETPGGFCCRPVPTQLNVPECVRSFGCRAADTVSVHGRLICTIFSLAEGLVLRQV